MNKDNKKFEVSVNDLNEVSSSPLSRLLDINQSLNEVENKEKELDKYLHSNIFNYVENKEHLVDVLNLATEKPSAQDELSRYGLVLDRTVPMLEVRNLTKYYENQKLPVLVNTSFKVYPGDLHVLVGASGSGKTTLLKCLLGKESYEGEILVDNKITTQNSEWMQFVGVVEADLSVDKSKTVHQYLLDAAMVTHTNEAHANNLVRSALEKFNLWSYRSRSLTEAPLLVVKKTTLAAALFKSPKLLVLDEPLTGLQHFEKVEFLMLLAKLQQSNRAILVFSHLIDEFSKFANLITILSQGRVFYSGLVSNLALQNIYKFNVVTSNNELALSLLKKINCQYRYNEVTKSILVKFDDKFNLLLFQKDASAKNIIITEQKHAATELEDLYNVLLKVGTAEAIREIDRYRLEHKNK